MDVKKMIGNKIIEGADGSRVDFNDVSLESLGTHLIFGEVNQDSMRDACTFLLKANKIFNDEELTIFVNSMGGTTNDGFALIDLMDISRLPIRTVAIGNICSMGVLIACAGRKGRRIMTRNTQIMAHQFSWYVEGKFHELQAANKAQEHLAYQFTQHFLRHTSMTEQQVKDVMFGPSDRWLTPQECKRFGMVDIILDELPDPFTRQSPAVSQSRESGSKRRARPRT